MSTERADWLARVIGVAAEDAGVGISMTIADGKSLQTVYASDAAHRVLGLVNPRTPRDSLTTILAADAASPELAAHVSAFLASGASPPSYATKILRDDGQIRTIEVGLGPFSVEGVPAVVAFIADVTDSLQEAESLKKSGERFRTLVESIPEAIFMTRGTTLTYANRAFIQLFGIPEDPSTSDVDLLELLHADDAARFSTLVEELSPGTSRQAEFQMVSRDGRGVTLEVSAMGIDVGEPGALFLGHDATARREFEMQLLQVDRLEVLGTLAAGMAHAINNPLSYTVLNLEHVTRHMRDLGTDSDYYAEARVRLAEAHDGAERVAKVVRQMRSLSRARASAPGPADIRAVLDNVLSMIGNEIRYSASLILRYDATPPVWAREGELEQALLSLVLYVARAVPDGAQKTREIRISLGTSASGDAILTVSDDGLFLPAGAATDLLDPFGSASSGLGLTMSHAVFASLDGRLEVEGMTGGGTVLRVVLPAAGSRAVEGGSRAPLPPARTPRPEAAHARARVLVVDDDPGVASTLRAMLEAQHEVKSVESAREGLRLLMGPEEFDVVFCDLVMPEVSGIDLYCALELKRPDRAERLVFMTGGVFTPEAERFLARVQNPRIEKPFSLLRVEQLLAQAVAPRGSVRAPAAPAH
jgi:PAS domain S-box-containing protein